MKRRKNKGAVVAIVASLSTVSLVSVGFAAWLITGGDTETIESSIVANEFTDARYLIEACDGYKTAQNKVAFTTANANNAVVFGPDKTGVTDPWLTVGNSDPTEALVATTNFWLGNGTGASVSGSTLVKDTKTILTCSAVTIDSTHSSDYAAAVTAEYVAALPTPVVSLATGDGSTKTENGVTWQKVILTLTFDWGDHTGGVNPYIYYNGLSDTEANKTDASAMLRSVYKLNGASYSITLTSGIQE